MTALGIASQNPNGTYSVPSHHLTTVRELGYRRNACTCGYGSFPCPVWREEVDHLIDAQVTQLALDLGEMKP